MEGLLSTGPTPSSFLGITEDGSQMLRRPDLEAGPALDQDHAPEFQYCLFVRLVSEHIFSWA